MTSPFDLNIYQGNIESITEEIIRAKDGSFVYIVTPNINHVVRLRDDAQLALAYSTASWTVCDSRILKPLLFLLRRIQCNVIPGSDLVSRLLPIANEMALKVSIIGCNKEDVAIIKEKFPRMITFHINPPMGFMNNETMVLECVDFVKRNPANFVFFAVGSPRQEILARLIHSTNEASGVGLCVGASLNFISGRVRRAPIWIQRLHLEWLHRIVMEPRRLARRYIFDALALLAMIFSEISRSLKNR